jgi:hypothetical protein
MMLRRNDGGAQDAAEGQGGDEGDQGDQGDRPNARPTPEGEIVTGGEHAR